MLGELLEVVKKLFEVSNRFNKTGDNKLKKLKDLFKDLEKSFLGAAKQLKDGKKIGRYEKGEFKTYANKLPDILKDICTEKEIEAFSNALNELANDTTSINNNNRQNWINEIETLAGMFKGLSVIISTDNRPFKLFSPSVTSRRNFVSTAAVTTLGVIGSSLATQYVKMPFVTWKMANFLEGNDKLILSKAPKMIIKRISEMTGGNFQIELYNDSTIGTEEILTNVSDGKDVECGFSGIYYNKNKYKVLSFFSAIPHGLTPQEQTAWLLYKKNKTDKLTYIQKIYEQEELGLNVIPFPAATTGMQMGGWFKKKVEKIKDFDGITMRIPGLGGEVLKEFGVKLDKDLPGGAIPANRIAEDIRTDKIQAAEWVGPHDDLLLGLHQAGAKYYYYPGWWEASTTFDMLVNKKAWENLPENYQEIFKAVCLETYTKILAEYNQNNSKIFEEIRAGRHGDIIVEEFSPQILQATQSKTQELLEYYAEKNNLFKEVYEEWKKFKYQIREWSKLSKNIFDDEDI